MLMIMHSVALQLYAGRAGRQAAHAFSRRRRAKPSGLASGTSTSRTLCISSSAATVSSSNRSSALLPVEAVPAWPEPAPAMLLALSASPPFSTRRCSICRSDAACREGFGAAGAERPWWCHARWCEW